MATETSKKRPNPTLEAGRVELLVFNVSHVDLILGVLRAGGDAGAAAQRLLDEEDAVVRQSEDVAFARPRFNAYYPLCLQVKTALDALGDRARTLSCPFVQNARCGVASEDAPGGNAAANASQEIIQRAARVARAAHSATKAVADRTTAASAHGGAASASAMEVESGESNGGAAVSESKRGNGNSGEEVVAAAAAAAAAAEEEEEEEDQPADAPRNVPVGLGLECEPVQIDSWRNMHLRQGEEAAAGDGCAGGPKVVAVMLPLLAQVLATWIEIVDAADFDSLVDMGSHSKRVVFLISGAGKPRNRELDIRSNSTKGAAKIMELFIKRTYPGVETRCLDSGLGVFHYDQNVSFCNETVLPALEEIRHPLVTTYGDEWKKRLRLTIALTDGSPARLAALGASLRTYRPNYLHMWQLKTFWYEHKFFRDDLIYQSFETMETKPPVPMEELDKAVRELVVEMRKHKEQFAAAKASRSVDELGAFWLRKTRKCVLSVLMVQSPNDAKPRFFRGMNLEVSMPTGSLCSERNVIGTALASDPTLRRQDLRMISVLSMTLDPPPMGSDTPAGTPQGRARPSPDKHRSKVMRSRSRSSSSSLPSVQNSSLRFLGELNPIQPCGACNEWLKKIAEVNPTFKVVTFPNSDCDEAFVQEVH